MFECNYYLKVAMKKVSQGLSLIPGEVKKIEMQENINISKYQILDSTN